jgi:hypothetical protein
MDAFPVPQIAKNNRKKAWRKLDGGENLIGDCGIFMSPEADSYAFEIVFVSRVE